MRRRDFSSVSLSVLALSSFSLLYFAMVTIGYHGEKNKHFRIINKWHTTTSKAASRLLSKAVCGPHCGPNCRPRCGGKETSSSCLCVWIGFELLGVVSLANVVDRINLFRSLALTCSHALERARIIALNEKRIWLFEVQFLFSSTSAYTRLNKDKNVSVRIGGFFSY